MKLTLLSVNVLLRCVVVSFRSLLYHFVALYICRIAHSWTRNRIFHHVLHNLRVGGYRSSFFENTSKPPFIFKSSFWSLSNTPSFIVPYCFWCFCWLIHSWRAIQSVLKDTRTSIPSINTFTDHFSSGVRYSITLCRLFMSGMEDVAFPNTILFFFSNNAKHKARNCHFSCSNFCRIIYHLSPFLKSL